MDWGIEIRPFKELDLRGADVIAGIPSVGLVGPVAASHLVAACGLDQVCAFESPGFPPVSMIYASKPKHPVRIYASEPRGLAVVLAEFDPAPDLARPLAYTILDWAENRGAGRVIAVEGFLPPGAAADAGEEEEAEIPAVMGIGSTDAARAALAEAGVPPFEQGMVTGVAGVLLNEGRWRRRDVLALMAPARPDIPDARAAAAVLEALARMLPALPVDVAPLVEQAIAVEGRVRAARAQARPALAPEAPGPTRLVVDPVCGMIIVPSAAAGKVEHRGRTYYFCSEACLRKFRADPAAALAHPEFA